MSKITTKISTKKVFTRLTLDENSLKAVRRVQGAIQNYDVNDAVKMIFGLGMSQLDNILPDIDGNNSLKNKASNQWIYSSNQKVKIMTDEDFKIEKFGEMIEIDKEYLKEIVKNRNLEKLKKDIAEIIDKILEINDLSAQERLKVIQKINNFKSAYFTIWQHAGVLGIDSDFHQLLKENKLVE